MTVARVIGLIALAFPLLYLFVKEFMIPGFQTIFGLSGYTFQYSDLHLFFVAPFPLGIIEAFLLFFWYKGRKSYLKPHDKESLFFKLFRFFSEVFGVILFAFVILLVFSEIILITFFSFVVELKTVIFAIFLFFPSVLMVAGFWFALVLSSLYSLMTYTMKLDFKIYREYLLPIFWYLVFLLTIFPG